MKDSSTIQCVEPPPDVVAKGVIAKADLAAERIGNLLKGTGEVDVDIERIRQEVPPDVSAFEVIGYRICVQYGNGVLSRKEYNSFTDRILPKLKNSAPTRQVSQLVIEGVDDPLALVPQNSQPRPPKARAFAKIRVRNTGEGPVSNIRVTIVRVNDRPDSRFQLAVSSLNTIFVSPITEVPQVSADLNPGEDAYFDAVIECNGKTCRPGELAIPYIENGKRFFMVVIHDNASQLQEFTVRVSGDTATATTATFRVRKHETKGYLFLETT